MDMIPGWPNKHGTSVFVLFVVALALPVIPSISTLYVIDAQARTLDWGSVKEVTDQDDLYRDNIGNVIGYLDKTPVTAINDGRMYVAWESSERKKGGSMILVRSLKGDSWGRISSVAGVEDGVIDNDPALASFNGELYLAWQHSVNGDDTEIYCTVLSGDDWTDCGEISGTNDYGMDSSPVLAVYDGMLWCAWVTRSTVTGRDKGGGDIVVRSFNGQEWDPKITIVSPTPANGYDDQPRLIEYNNKLIVAWVTRDKKTNNGTSIDVVFKDYDGSSWGTLKRASVPDSKDEDDTYPSMAVFNGRLYFTWQSEGDVQFETDIAVSTWDGSKVSNETRITPKGDMAADEHPFAKTFGNRLFVCWNSNDPNYTDGSDDDIAIAYYDGNRWSYPEEVTPSDLAEEHAAQDKFPVMENYKGGLYVLWEQDDQRTAVIDAGDIKYRRYPPEGSGTDYTMMALIIVVIILAVIFVAVWAFLPSKGKRTERYIERKQRESMRDKALSRAGGRTRGGRKRKDRKKH